MDTNCVRHMGINNVAGLISAYDFCCIACFPLPYKKKQYNHNLQMKLDTNRVILADNYQDWNNVPLNNSTFILVQQKMLTVYLQTLHFAPQYGHLDMHKCKDFVEWLASNFSGQGKCWCFHLLHGRLGLFFAVRTHHSRTPVSNKTQTYPG